MTPEERDLIAGLAERLRAADNNSKDREAEQFIRDLVQQQPSAPYLLVQTVLVQEHALTNAQSRIAALERQVADLNAAARNRGENEPQASTGGGVGSFLSGLLGGRPQPPAPAASNSPPPASGPGAPVPPPVPRAYAAEQPPAQPYPSTMNMSPSAGGGFLRGALATAAGVAGGAMLFQGLQGLMGHNSGPFGGGGGSGFGGGFGGGHFAGGGQPLETGSHDVVNNYYGDSGRGTEATGGQPGEESAETHGDMLRQSSEPVDDDGAEAGQDASIADSGDFGNDASVGGGDNFFADSGGGDSYDSGDGDYV